MSEARDVMRPFGQASATIQTLGGDTLRVRSEATSEEDAGKIRDALADAAGIEPGDVAVTTVGPTWGSEISHKAIRALIFFLVVVGLYITWTLREWRMAVGALAAVLHDIVISLGVYALFCGSRSPRRRSSPSSRSSASRSTTRSWCSTRSARTLPRSRSRAA